MLCKICKEGLEGIWDPERTRRLKIDNSDEEYGNGMPCNVYVGRPFFLILTLLKAEVASGSRK